LFRNVRHYSAFEPEVSIFIETTECVNFIVIQSFVLSSPVVLYYGAI
jgi:hypothetical protein